MYKKTNSFCLFFLSFIFLSNSLLSREIIKSTLELKEDTLKGYFEKIQNSNNDMEKQNYNRKILKIFEDILTYPESFAYPFDSLKNLGKLFSPDKLFRIYNWNIPYTDGTHQYFGYIQYYPEKEKKYLVFPLVDKSEEITQPETASLTNLNWFGALYYKIILTKYSGKKYYTLLAFDFNNNFSRKKLVEVLFFTKDGHPQFGAPIFQINQVLKKRIIFEYSSQVVMSLKYMKKSKMIVYDHLSPIDSSYKGQYQFYGPDLSYDGFVFKKGKWLYVADVTL